MNPVNDLIQQIETSWEYNSYNYIIFNIGNDEIHTTIEDITYVTRYFFKIKAINGELHFININNLIGVKLI